MARWWMEYLVVGKKRLSRYLARWASKPARSCVPVAMFLPVATLLNQLENVGGVFAAFTVPTLPVQ